MNWTDVRFELMGRVIKLQPVEIEDKLHPERNGKYVASFKINKPDFTELQKLISVPTEQYKIVNIKKGYYRLHIASARWYKQVKNKWVRCKRPFDLILYKQT